MAIHIRNQATDRLVRELAEKTGLSPSDAIHEAVQQRLLQHTCPQPVPQVSLTPQNATVAAIDERRLQLARFDGMDAAIDAVRESIFIPSMLCLLMLLATPLIGDRIAGIVLLITMASGGLLFSYSRSLAREKASRTSQRLALARELRALCDSLPEELNFLAWIPQPPAAGLPQIASVATRQPVSGSIQ
jgi:hypothetical protein